MRDSKFAAGDRVRLLDEIYQHKAGDVFIVLETEDLDFDLYLHAEGDRSDTSYVHRALFEAVPEPKVDLENLRNLVLEAQVKNGTVKRLLDEVQLLLSQL